MFRVTLVLQTWGFWGRGRDGLLVTVRILGLSLRSVSRAGAWGSWGLSGGLFDWSRWLLDLKQ